jgi:gliding motility-associated-like protein
MNRNRLQKQFLRTVFFTLIISGFAIAARAQVTALQARHETDNQNSITVTLNGTLGALYNTTTGWSVTVGGVSVPISSVIGANGSSQVTITWPIAQAVNVGQAVVVNFAGDAAINPIVAMASQNDRSVICSDFQFAANIGNTPPCAPVDPNTIMVFSVKRAARNSSRWNINGVRARVYWDVASSDNSVIQSYESDIAGNAASGSYFIAVNSASSTYVYPSNEAVCGYTSTWLIRLFDGTTTTLCTLSDPNQRVTYASFNTDAAGEGDGQLITTPTVANTDQVCEGQPVNMSFTDNSDLNCIDIAAAPDPIPRNQFTRWVRVIYGWPHDAGNTIRNVTVGGTQITDANGDLLPAFAGAGFIPTVANALGTPDPFGVVEFPAAVTGPSGELETITSTATLEGDAGRTFNITLQYWNVCNAYSTGDFSNVRSITDQVVVINAPVAPTVSPNPGDFCNNQTNSVYNFTASGAGGTFTWYRDAALLDPEKTGASFNPVTEGTPAVSKTTAGNYTYYVTETLGNGCTSPPTTVNFMIRNALSQPPVFSGPTNLCPSSTYTWTVPSAPATETFGGATEYVWTYPAGWTFVSQTATAITLTTNTTVASGTVSVAKRYVNAPQCTSTARSLTVNVRARPTVNITPDPATICEGSTIQLNGNPSLPPTAAGFTPSISAHTWTGSTTVLDDASIQQPTVQSSTVPGSYPLSYVVTADFGSGVSCASVADNLTVTVSATPTPASVGANQNLCQILLTSNPLGGSNPAPGTGTWTVQSKPAGSNVTFDGGVNDRNSTITVDKNGIYVLRWTVVNGSCTSFADVQVDFGTDPGVQDAGSANSFCGFSGSLNAVAPTVGTISWSQTAGPGSTTFSATNITNPTITVTQFGTYTYRYRVSSGTCAPQDATVNITFNQPATSTPMANFTSCVDPGVLAPIALTGTVGGGATGGRWERVTAGAGLGNLQSSGTSVGNTVAGVTVTDSYVPTATDFTNGSVQLRLVASGATAPCPEVSNTITVTFDRRPTVVNAGAAQPLVCANPTTGSTVLAATAPNNGGTGTWSGPGGVTFSNVNSPTAIVSNLPVGTTTLTWTVTSAAGVCSSQQATVDVTVNALPDANNPAPSDQCETTFGSGVANGVNLTGYNDGVTGIVGSTNRTIEWYSSLPRIAANMIATPTSFNVSNGQTLYTRVINTLTNCQRDGQVTFTINPLPVANTQTLEFCEVFPSGSNQVTGIDLTAASVITGVTGGAANRAVTWFNSQAGALTNNAGDLVATPGSLTINGNQSVYARVRNTVTGCINVAEVDLVVKPRPADPTIFGSGNQCVGNFDLYNVNPVGGATYIWDVDDNAATEFDVIAGGTASDFLVVVSFPNVYTGDVRVTLDLNGCQSNQVSKTITVDATPPPVTISASDNPVCENQAGVVYTATSLPNTNYTWEIPAVGGATGSSIIGGQGSNQVTVNVAATSGDIRVTPQTQGGSCAGATATFFIDVRQKPVLDPNLNTSVCSDTPIGVTLGTTGAVPATGYSITNVTVSAGLNPSTRPNVTNQPANVIANDSYENLTGGNLTVRYTVVPVSADDCEGAAVDVFVTIKPEPTLDPNLGKTLCSRESTNINLKVATGSFPADQFEIVSITPNGLTASAGAPATGVVTPSAIADDAWINNTGAPVIVVYNIRPINSVTSCVGDPPLPLQVVVNSEPVVTPDSETICSGSMPTITLASSMPGSTFAWTVNNITGTVLGATNGTGSTLNNQLVNNSGLPGTVTYSVVATGSVVDGICVGQPELITITVNTAPTANSITQTQCSDVAGGTTYDEDLQALESTVNNGGGVTFSWYQDLALTTPITAPTLNDYPLTNNIPVYVEVDNGQCTKVATVTYTVNPLPALSAAITSNYNGAQLSCNGSSDGQITSSAASGSGPYLFSIDAGTSYFTGGTFNGLSAAGSPYVVRVRDAKGCEVDSPPMNFVSPVAVTASAAKTLSYNGQDVSCQAAADGQITVTPAGGTGAYTFRLLELPGNTTGDASGVYSGLRAGAYTFVVKDVNNCQVTTSTITVTEPTAIQASAVLTTPVRCHGESNGEITVTATGGTLVNPNYTFEMVAPVTSNNTGLFTGLSFGTYTVNVRDDNGCVKAANSIVVTEPTTLTGFASVSSNYNGAKISCPGADDGQITAVANGGNGGYVYVLDQDAGNLSGQADGSFDAISPGSFTVTVTDSKGCVVTTAPVTLTDPVAITASASITTTISCFGFNDGQITVSGTGGTGAYTYSMVMPVASNASGVFSGLSQGTYDFLVTDLNGCSDAVQQVLSEPTQVTASAAVTSNYNGSQVSCNGSSDGVITITANGGTGAFSYVFDQFALTNTSGALSGIFNSVGAGTGYTFTVKDAKNCTVITAPVDVTQPTAVTVSGAVTSNYNGEDITCLGASDGIITATPGGGTGAVYTFVLNQSPSNTSGNASGIYNSLAAGTYTITARDVNSCFAVSAPVTIASPTAVAGSAAVTSNYNGRQITCNGASDGVITASPSGGVSGYTFVLNEIPANVSGAASGIFNGLPEGNYTVTISDANGCPKVTNTVVVTDPDLLTASASVTSNYNGEQVTCTGASDAVIKVTATGGTTAYAFVFNEIGGNTTGQATGSFTGIPAGASYTFTVTDINNCVANTAPISVSEPDPLVVSAAVTSTYNGAQISCNNAKDGIITVTVVSGGTGVPTYAFDQVASNQTGKFSGIFSSVDAGTGYTFTVTDVNGCAETTAPLDVTQPAALGATGLATSNYNGFNVSCFNLTDAEITVTPSGGTTPLLYTLLENPSNVTGQTTGVFNGLRSGTFRVRIADVNGCLFTTTAITVTQPNDIAISIDVTSNYNGFDVSCEGASDGEVSVTAIAGGAGGYEYTFDPDAANVSGQASGVFTGVSSGLYTIIAEDDNGCIKESLPVILIDPLPLFEGVVGLDQAICIGADAALINEFAAPFGGIGNYTYQWVESTDNISYANVPTANAATYDPPAIPETRYYKRQVTSGSCVTLESNVVTVKVNPLPTVVDFSPSKTPVCEGDFFLLNFEFTGTAPFFFDFDATDLNGTTSTVDRIGAAVTPVPVINYAETTTYTLTKVRDFNGCILNPNLQFTVPVSKIDPGFSITSAPAQCSGGTFSFEWKVDANIEYTWFWNDGAPEVIAANTLPSGTQTITHVYNSVNPVSNTNIPITLSARNTVDGCGPKQSNQTVTIYPNITLNVVPDKTEICSDETVKFVNVSSGGTTHRWYYHPQGTASVVDERIRTLVTTENFTFPNATANNPIVYEVEYEVSNANCSDSRTIPITVYKKITANFTEVVPQFVGGEAIVLFTNTSDPLDDTQFDYAWDFGSSADTPTGNGIGPFSVRYTTPGVKSISLVATNEIAMAAGLNCNSSVTHVIDILLPALIAAFDYEPKNACFPSDITITDNNATGDLYEWQLIDQTGRVLLTSNEALPTFRIVNPGAYAIRLTTTNSFTSQTASTITADPINIFSLPIAGFDARPRTLFIPQDSLYTFNFSSSTSLDTETEYWWNFGDDDDYVIRRRGDLDPAHMYGQEGRYTVTLITREAHIVNPSTTVVCADTTTLEIVARDVGQIQVPNAFTPNPAGPNGGVVDTSTPNNDVFLPIIKGNIKEFMMQVFDRWGNLVFESRDKNRGWDGYDRNGNLLPAGVYVFKLEMLLENNKRTTQIGDVTMIR